MTYTIVVADNSHLQHAQSICQMMDDAAKVRGTGIAKRKPEYIQLKMEEGKAVVALLKGEVVGFCYIESWGNDQYVANSGLIVHPDHRKTGLAKSIKQAIFNLSVKKYPDAKLFGITTSLAVMKINSSLGYKPVPFSELTDDENFWKGCQTCTNYDILQRTNKTMCMCTGMICNPKELTPKVAEADKNLWGVYKTFMAERKVRLLQKAEKFPFLKSLIKTDEK